MDKKVNQQSSLTEWFPRLSRIHVRNLCASWSWPAYSSMNWFTSASARNDSGGVIVCYASSFMLTWRLHFRVGQQNLLADHWKSLRL